MCSSPYGAWRATLGLQMEAAIRVHLPACFFGLIRRSAQVIDRSDVIDGNHII